MNGTDDLLGAGAADGADGAAVPAGMDAGGADGTAGTVVLAKVGGLTGTEGEAGAVPTGALTRGAVPTGTLTTGTALTVGIATGVETTGVALGVTGLVTVHGQFVTIRVVAWRKRVSSSAPLRSTSVYIPQSRRRWKLRE